ncbi:MAG: exo-alpha-sialidase [Planctomycetes bacterium]|nr:exo-alpha-sialidase [Planctomycetota bacterium]
MSKKIWAATRKGVFEIVRGKGGWAIRKVHFPAQNCSMLLPDRRDGALYAALGHGHFGVKLHRSDNGGKSWTEITSPAYPKQPEGEDAEWKTYFGTAIRWNLELVWELAAGGADEPGVLWCGTLPGGLFRSKDRGKTWELNMPMWNSPRRKKWMGGGMDLPGIHSVCVNPNDSKHVTVGISCAGVWITKDGGKSWDNDGKGMRGDYVPPEQAYLMQGQDPHRIAQCPADPNVLWVQHHNGIFRSTDGGANWTELKGVKPSVFGFAVVVHPKDPKTAWFVPAEKDERRVPVKGQVVVTRTRDGGKTFKTLRKGLPQKHAYDICFRHCLDVDETGDRLVFGSTTGSLWVSENQGDRWKTLAEHLPPIYCVRFG